MSESPISSTSRRLFLDCFDGLGCLDCLDCFCCCGCRRRDWSVAVEVSVDEDEDVVSGGELAFAGGDSIGIEEAAMVYDSRLGDEDENEEEKEKNENKSKKERRGMYQKKKENNAEKECRQGGTIVNARARDPSYDGWLINKYVCIEEIHIYRTTPNKLQAGWKTSIITGRVRSCSRLLHLIYVPICLSRDVARYSV